MPTISVNVASGADNGLATWYPALTFRSYRYSTRPAAGNHMGGNVGLAVRFQNVNIPQGTTITSATLKFIAATTNALAAVQIYGKNVDNAAAWGTGQRIRTMPKTSQKTKLDTTSATSSNNVTAIVQAVIDRGGWTANNALAFGGFNTFALPAAATHIWTGKGFADGGSNIPNLSITYPNQPVFDAASSSAYEAALSTYSWTHTVAVQTNRVLLVSVSIFATGSVTGITYNGVALTQDVSATVTNGVYRSEVWYLIAPATGANTVAVTLNASLTSIANACSFYNVHQTTPIEATATNTGMGNPASGTVTTIAANSLVFGNLVTPTASGVTSAAGQNSRDINSGALGTSAADNKDPVVTPAAVTLTWNGIGTLDTWATSIVSLQVPAGSITYNDTITETSTASESEIGKATDSASLSQSTTITYSISGSVSSNNLLTETYTGTDSAIGSAKDSSGLTETDTASDNYSNGAQTYNAVITETATSSDLINGVSTSANGAIEIISPSDASVGVATDNALLNENAIANDNYGETDIPATSTIVTGGPADKRKKHLEWLKKQKRKQDTLLEKNKNRYSPPVIAKIEPLILPEVIIFEKQIDLGEIAKIAAIEAIMTLASNQNQPDLLKMDHTALAFMLEEIREQDDEDAFMMMVL